MLTTAARPPLPSVETAVRRTRQALAGLLSLWLATTAPAIAPPATTTPRITNGAAMNWDERFDLEPARTSLGPAVVASDPVLGPVLVSESLAAGLAGSAKAGAAIMDRAAAAANRRPVKRMADLFRGCGTDMSRAGRSEAFPCREAMSRSDGVGSA